ncbi:MAG: ABC transporter permease [Alphaproteobacteria bacterium]|nr:ABC transporter permease [Alphaproteobacteria bacterium]
MNRGIRRLVVRLGGWSGAVGASIVLAIALAALLAPWIAPYDPVSLNLERKLQAPDAAHWFGTDQAGRDILSRAIWGARVSLMVGVLAVVIGLVGGVGLGLVAAYYSGGLVEQAIMRTVDAIASIPLLIWAIAVVGIIGVGPVLIGPFRFANEFKLLVLIGFLYMPGLARVTYTVAQIEAVADYVRARRVQGARDLAIMFGDVLPNCLSPLIVQGTLLVAIGIVVEASVSFVGLGVQPPTPSWGTMLADSRNYLFSGEWWLPVFPGLAISVTVVGFNLLGDALRDMLDPRRSTGRLIA